MHAVLITAYKDYDCLLRLMARLDRSFFKLFIHVDRKSSYTQAQVQRLSELGAEVSRTFHTGWGSHAHLKAILSLLDSAVAEGSTEYIHIISGQDYPLWDPETFRRRCDGQIYIDHGPLEEQPPHIRERYELGDPFHALLSGPLASRRVHKFLYRKTLWARRLVGRRRVQFGPYRGLYKGLVWCSFPISAGAHLLHDANAQAFLSAIKNTRIAEEVFFSTYFLNSELASLVVRDSLRYVDWSERNGSSPAVLDESDAEAVLRSSALFMRKVSSTTSTELLNEIDGARFRSPLARER